MKIGEKRIVVSEIPFGVLGKNENLPKIKILDCVEEKQSKGEFTGKEGIGYIFKDSEGHLYGFNYPEINETFTGNVFTRFMRDQDYLKLSDEEKDKLLDYFYWYDIKDVYLPKPLSFTKDLNFISFCHEHLRYHYNTIDGCKWCKHGLPHKKENLNKIIKNTSHWYKTKLKID